MIRINSILDLFEPKNVLFLDIFILMSILNSMLSLVEHEKIYITSGPAVFRNDYDFLSYI